MRSLDELPDDRVVCGECLNCDTGSFRCRAFKVSVLVEQPLRCVKFRPIPRLQDQRPGSERWPQLKQDIESVRASDAAHRAEESRRK